MNACERLIVVTDLVDPNGTNDSVVERRLSRGQPVIGAVSNQTNLSDLLALMRSTADATTGAAAEGATATTRPRGGPPGPPPEALSSAAELLGMSEDELTSALQSGSTLKDLAATQGVSESDLLAAIVNGLKTGIANHTQGVGGTTRPVPSDERLTEIATHIINGNRPPAPSEGVPDGASRDLTLAIVRSLVGSESEDGSAATGVSSSSVRSAYAACSAPTDADDLSESLGIDVASLLEQLKSGTHLSDIAAQSEVSTDDLLSSLLMGMLTDTKA